MQTSFVGLIRLAENQWLRADLAPARFNPVRQKKPAGHIVFLSRTSHRNT
jgi:hypothetical protein